MGVHVCPIIPIFTANQDLAWEKICVPEAIVCDPNPENGPIRDCEDTWNNSHCVTDENFFMRYESGDLIQFQTKFRDEWNDDPDAPVDGWNTFIKAKLISNDTGATLSEDVADFASRYYVAWNGKESFQVIEIDTSLPIFDDVICWHLEFETYRIETINEGEEDEEDITIIDSTACSEDWCDCGDCDEWPLLESLITGYDGHGYWHGEAEAYVGTGYFVFKPAYRFPFEIVQVGSQISSIVTNTTTLDFEAAAVFTAGTIMPVPPYVLNMLTFGFLTGRLLNFAGKTYSREDISIRRTNKRSEMLVFTFDLLKYERQAKKDC